MAVTTAQKDASQVRQKRMIADHYNTLTYCQMNQIDISAPIATVRRIILNPDVVLRLNPSWHVRKISGAPQGPYALTLYDDREWISPWK